MPKLNLKIPTVIFGLIIISGIFPYFANQYWIRIVTVILMYAALAQATNIIMGFCGLVPFGNVAFFGIGAYITGMTMNYWGLPFFMAVILGSVACAVFTLIVGSPILKLKGHYFAIATFGMSEAVHQIVANIEATGGGMGLNLPLLKISAVQGNQLFYFLMLFMALFSTGVAIYVLRSRTGFALRAIMANEEGGKSLGINTAYYKVLAWAISAFLTGMVGGIYAYWYAYIDPPSVFDLNISVRFIIMTLIGGAGTIIGPILGAAFIELLTETIWSKFLSFHLGVLGSIIVLVVIFMPKGLMWWYQQKFSLNALLNNVKRSKI